MLLDCIQFRFAANINFRAIYYSNKAAANIKLNNWEAAIDDCTEALELGMCSQYVPKYAHFRTTADGVFIYVAYYR